MAKWLRSIVAPIRAYSTKSMFTRTFLPSTLCTHKHRRIGRPHFYVVRLPFSSAASTEKSIHRILLTGGPCAGKSTALSTLKQFLMNHGFVVFVIPEAATLLQMHGGMKLSYSTLPIFQKAITTTQHALEKAYFEYAMEIQPSFDGKPIVILIDRGIMDGAAYITDGDKFKQILKQVLHTEQEIDTTALLHSKYDMVLHLVTAAIGAERFYQTEQFRAESKEDAIALDKRLQDVYKTHKHRRVVHNVSSFDEKLSTLISHVAEKLNIASLTRKTLRFTVSMKDQMTDLDRIVAELQKTTSQKHSFIVTYVIKYFLQEQDDQHEQDKKKNVYTFIRETNVLDIKSGLSVYSQMRNIRERSLDSSAMYINRLEDFEHIEIPSKAGAEWADATHYMLIRNSEEHESGEIISESQTLSKTRYNELRRCSRDREKQRVEKVKIFFDYKQQFYALDVYIKPNVHKDTMWLKVYRTPGNKHMPGQTDMGEDEVDVPPCINVLKNVTNDEDYSSFSLAGP